MNDYLDPEQLQQDGGQETRSCLSCGCHGPLDEAFAPLSECRNIEDDCHRSFWHYVDTLDEHEKRAMWGDR